MATEAAEPESICGRLTLDPSRPSHAWVPDRRPVVRTRGPHGTMSTATNRPARRRRPSVGLVAVTVVVLASFGTLAVATDAVGAGRLFDRAIGALDGIIGGRVPDGPAEEALV